MGQGVAIAVFTLGEGAKKFCDPAAEIHRQAQNGTELNNDGVHLPVAVGKTNMRQRLGDSKMRRGTDGQKLRAPLNDSQHYGQQVVVQASSSGWMGKYFRNPRLQNPNSPPGITASHFRR